MTIDADAISDDELEARVSAALRTLADTQVPDDAATAPPHGGRRWFLAVAAGLLLVVGVGGLVALGRSDPPAPADQPVETTRSSATTPGSSPGTDAVTTAAPPTTDPGAAVVPATAGADESNPVDDKIDREIGVLSTEFAPDGGVVPGPVERWLHPVGSPTNAIRRDGDGALIGALSWQYAPDSQWTKFWHDAPDVTLADGRGGKRSEFELARGVGYAVQTDRGLFTASMSPEIERQLGDWFAEIAGEPLDAIEPPAGFAAIPDVVDSVHVQYDSLGVDGSAGMVTSRMESPTPLADWIDATAPFATVTTLGDGGQAIMLVEEEFKDGTFDRFLAWQPELDTVVEVRRWPQDRAATADDLVELVDDLSFVPRDQAPLEEYRNTAMEQMVPKGEAPDLLLLGETSEGRFAFVRTEHEAGRLCQTFTHEAYGGGGGCGPDDEASAFDCGSGWAAPEELHAHVFVPGRHLDNVTATLEGDPVEPNIETGTTDGVDWTFASVRANGYPESPLAQGEIPVNLLVDGEPCFLAAPPTTSP